MTEAEAQMQKLCDLPNGQPLYYADETFADSGFYTWDRENRENVKLEIRPAGLASRLSSEDSGGVEEAVEEAICAELFKLRPDLDVEGPAWLEDPLADEWGEWAHNIAAAIQPISAQPQLSDEDRAEFLRIGEIRSELEIRADAAARIIGMASPETEERARHEEQALRAAISFIDLQIQQHGEVEEETKADLVSRLAQSLALAMIDLEKVATVRGGECFTRHPAYLKQALEDHTATADADISDEMRAALAIPLPPWAQAEQQHHVSTKGEEGR